MKKVLSLLIILALIVVAWVFASPYWAVYQLKKAYDAQQADTISAAIEFTQLQQSIKSQLTPVLIEKANHVAKSPILQMLNIALNPDDLVNKMVNQAVDNTVTPEGVQYALTGQATSEPLKTNVKLLGGLVAVAMDKIDIKDLILARNSAELNQKIKQQLQSPNPNATTATSQTQPTTHYCGFNCFEVSGQLRGYPLTLRLQRQGLIHWKIVGVTLPLNA